MVVFGLQETEGNGFCHEHSNCMKSTERNLIRGHLSACFIQYGQVDREA